ncbi:MAG: WYL domain-containing protein, partial [Candidatus Nanopelagicales bacterium]
MSARKTERQLDLLFILLNSSRPLSREVIRSKIEEYRNQENQDSFERMFERDKDELRAVGIPIETKSLDPLFDDEFGYELRLENLNLKNSFFNNEELA